MLVQTQNINQMFRVLLLLGCFFSGVLHADDLDNQKCVSILKSLYESIKVDFTSAAERKLIADAFSTVSDREAAKTAFEIYLRNRTKKLSPELSKQVSDVVEKRNYSTYPSNSLYVYFEKYIHLGLMPKWRESILEYQILAHELEHFIHDRAAWEQGVVVIGALRSKNFHIPATFLSELGAMTAEWQYINTIPLEARYRLIDSIDNAIDVYRPDIMIRFLKSGSMKRPAYIKNEWANDRYSLDGFRHNRY